MLTQTGWAAQSCAKERDVIPFAFPWSKSLFMPFSAAPSE
jgi:hypothetical protein